MPIYEFKCEDCGHTQEKLVRHSDPEDHKTKTYCGECQGIAQRVISLGSFWLKGDWFKTTGKY